MVECVLGILAQHSLAGTEPDFSLIRGLVLIDIANHLLDRLDTRGSLLRGLLCHGGLIARIHGVLIGFVGFIGG